MDKDYSKLIPPWKTVGISNSLMFRLVMDNEEICRGFIERLLDIRIARIKTQALELDVTNNLLSKGIRLDAYVEDENGIAYDIEMQTTDYGPEVIGKRMRYYQSSADMNLLKRGEHYRKLRKSFIVFICTFDPFGLKLPFYTFTNLCHEDKSLELQDDALKIIFNTTSERSVLTEAQASLLKYINGEGTQDAFTEKIEKQVQDLHNEPQKEMIYMTYSQILMDQKADGYSLGIKHGISQGISKGISKIVLNMLHKHRSLATIMEDTELSAEEVRKIAADNGLSCS